MAFKEIPVVAGKVAATLADYPAYVKPSAMTGWGSLTLAEAQSIRFYSDEAKTTELAREVVSADEIHVKVPSLTTSTIIYADYDGIRADYAVTDTYGRNAVWPSAYKGVFHLNETGTTVATDSSGTGNDLTPNAAANSLAAKLGNGRDINDTDNNWLAKTSPAGFSAGADYSITGWFKTDTTKTANHFLTVWDGGGTASDLSFINMVDVTNNDIQTFLRSGGTQVSKIIANTFNTNTWYKVTFAMDVSAGTLYGYVNGASIGSVSGFPTNYNAPAGSLSLGARDTDVGGTSNYDGIYDEHRIRLSLTSADWETTEYNNQSDVGTFWGTVTDAGGAPVAKKGFLVWL